MWPTIIIASLIGVVFALVVAKEIINKKKGKSSCSCGCGGCAFKDSCHSRTENK